MKMTRRIMVTTASIMGFVMVASAHGATGVESSAQDHAKNKTSQQDRETRNIDRSYITQDYWDQGVRAKYLNREEYTRSGYRPELQKISKLEGMPITSSGGKDLGTIKGLAVDPEAGRIAYAIISTGGLLGIGSEEYAVPFQLIRGSTRGERLVANVTEQEFKDAPKLSNDKQLTDRSYVDRVHRSFNARPYWEMTGMRDRGGMRHHAGTHHAREQRQDRGMRGQASRPGRVLMMEEIVDEDVNNLQGEELGDVKELMVDLSNGHIAYALINPDDTDRETAVPFDRLAVRETDEDETQLVARTTRDQLKSAPSWKQGQQPDMASTQWNEQIHRHYEEDPYYVVYGYVITAERDRDSNRYGQSRQDFAEGSLRSFSGKVAEVRNQSSAAGMNRPDVQLVLESYEEDHMDETIRRPQDEYAPTRHDSQDKELEERLTVNVAPRSFLESKNVDIERGDQVTVRGYMTERDGQRMLVATELEIDGGNVQLRDRAGNAVWQIRQTGQWNQSNQQQNR